ncbi:HpcH/HpaI aldolase/citrate lyase family protein [Leisingera sp. XS_AS12]|uniref:HpcH/HpaI aldolase/citrate lyase family protein n=1 Tax=Leisingera sp. XS_AS12 TaxID=3241294 RepID=UPI003510FA95
MHSDELHTRAVGLGATLYMPATNPHAKRVFAGEDLNGAGSVVICLEDALHENDVERGLNGLRSHLKTRSENGARHQKTMVFVRPRNLGMAHLISEMEGFSTVSGMIVPKMTLKSGPGWFELARDHETLIMPTLETAEYFDPGYVSSVADMFASEGLDRVMAVRLGGNDLLNCLGLRRTPGMTSYEGPLSYVLSMMGSQMMARGLPVAAPVFDIIHDTKTLIREVEQDVLRGFIGKTAIHPSQIGIIHEMLKVSREDLHMAKAILDDASAAVFQIHGVMCEPATHSLWARRILSRAKTWGVYEQPELEAVTSGHGREAVAV